jgi:tetratricopeptide (TPR) repeat protein
MRGRRFQWFGLALILAVYLLTYGRAATYAFVWDDVAEIQQSALFDRPLLDGISATQTERQDPGLTELASIRLAYDSYRPLLFTSYWLDVQLWGRSALAMHLVNLVLGALAVLCVHALARRLLGASAIAFVPAAIVAFHPLQVEAVVYISGRGDLLAGLFALCTALCVLRALDARTALWSALAALAFAASLFTKEACIGLPLAIAALLWAKQQLRARWWIVVLLIGVALGYLLVRRLVVVPTTSSAVLDGIAVVPGLCLEYARLVLLPFDLSTERLHDPRYVVAGWVVAALLAGVLVLAWRRRVALSRVALAGSVWFVALLAPSAVAIAGSTRVLADRYAYAALAGAAIALTAVAAAVVRARPRLGQPIAIAAALWGLLLVAVAWLQVPVWRDNHTLYAHAVAMTPNSSEAHYRLAYLAARDDDWEHAIPLLERAIELDPRNVRALSNLGVGLLRTGRPADAEAMLARAVATNPGAFRAWFNLGLARLALGKQAEGCSAIARALEINPTYAQAAQTLRASCQ